MGFAEITVAIIAVMLGISYYIGVLLVSIAPSQRIRNVGKEMLEDSGTSIVLLVFITGFFTIASSLFRMVYGTGADAAYDLTLNWINNDLTLVLSGMLQVSMIPILLKSLDATGLGYGVFSILASFIERTLAPWNELFSAYGALLSLLRAWVIFMRNGWLILLLTGALIYTFPARIGRIAGGWIMSMSIAFYALLPFTGVFVDIMTAISFSQILQTFHMGAENVYTYILANKATENVEGFVTYVISGLTSMIGDFGTIVFLRFIFTMLYLAIINGVTFSLSRALGATGRRLRLPGAPG